MEIYNNPEEINQEPIKKRSQFLTVLCILTFVFAGLSFVSSFFGLFSGPLSSEMMTQKHVQMAEQIASLQEVGANGFIHMMHQLEQMLDDVNNHYYSVLLAKLIWTLIGAFGAWQMWQGKKIGFHIYIIYCLLEIVQIYLFTSPVNIPLLVIIYDLVISGIMIILYSRNLKELK